MEKSVRARVKTISIASSVAMQRVIERLALSGVVFRTPATIRLKRFSKYHFPRLPELIGSPSQFLLLLVA
jgi:hypothetical protein